MVTMYFFDPSQGRRRRGLARDRLRSIATMASDAVDVARRDFGNRFAGVQARLGHMPGRRGKAPDDRVLAERVRSRIGRVVSHPHAIVVTAHEGHVALGGHALMHERQQLLDAVGGVAGVARVDDRLEVHEKPDGIPALQGAGRRAAARNEVAQQNWTPTLRATALVGGAMLGGYGMARRTPVGTALAVAGLALLARGVGNMSLKHMLGLGADAPGTQLEKTIDIDAPIDTVFDAFANYENFPHFMSHVVDVRDLGEQRSHWMVKGPAGSRLEWDTLLTASERPGLLSWQTAPGAMVEHAGSIHLEPTDSGTRATIRMTYRPPAGALGHGVAVLIGSDPKRELDADMLRMKDFIEGGSAPHDAAQPMTSMQKKNKRGNKKESRPNIGHQGH
ncbi:BON domain-containing protein [Massilia glaciei]|uniref:BON domain-containing protein n=2 Tax=Massilia glaciei TaxID=1524097 RepID=A0A2U2HLU9_9BURK|nr:BON domain-containing protein [Massilia glaciei]